MICVGLAWGCGEFTKQTANKTLWPSSNPYWQCHYWGSRLTKKPYVPGVGAYLQANYCSNSGSALAGLALKSAKGQLLSADTTLKSSALWHSPYQSCAFQSQQPIDSRLTNFWTLLWPVAGSACLGGLKMIGRAQLEWPFQYMSIRQA